MVTAEDAGKILREYFANVTPEQFRADVERVSPGFLEELASTTESEAKGCTPEIEEPTSFPVRINGLTAADLAPVATPPKSNNTEPVLGRAA